MKILAINPGSTSTKIALYEDENLVWKESIEHSLTELAAYSDIYAQYPMRIQLITEAMAKNDTKLEDLACVVGRGGPAMPFQAGAYRLNADLVHVLADHPKNSHIALLGGILAYNLAQETGIPAFIYDAVSTDEFEDVARFSGLKSIERISAGHYLNMRAAARKVAADLGTTVYDLNLLIAHLGGVVDRRYGEGAGAVAVTLTEAGLADPLFEGLSPSFRAFTGHKEACSVLPEGAVVLASGTACPVQAFRVGESVYVTQFHPELDAERLIARMGIYADAGYFDPDDFDALSASARAADVGDQPALILANFVARFAQP